MGIAVTQTLLDRFRQGQINTLGSHVSANSPAARTTLEGLRRMFVAHGSDPMTATQQAHIMVWDMVQKQAATIAYLDVYRLLMFLCLLAIPFVFLLKKPAHQTKPAVPAAE